MAWSPEKAKMKWFLFGLAGAPIIILLGVFIFAFFDIDGDGTFGGFKEISTIFFEAMGSAWFEFPLLAAVIAAFGYRHERFRNNKNRDHGPRISPRTNP